VLGQVAARIAGVPIIVNTVHGYYFHGNMRRLLRESYVFLERIAGRHSDLVLSQNAEDIQTAIQEGICHAAKIRYLGNGIDIRRFCRERISDDVKNKTRHSLGIPVQGPVVGFVGRLVREKGLPELLSAISTVVQGFPDLSLLIIGPVDHDKPDYLTPMVAEEYGLQHTCVFTGMRQDMPELYSLMDVFVLPSHREGFPRSPMEASAMRVPCVVTDIRGCREAVEHGRNGLLVPLGDTGALATAITEILNDGVRSRQMGEIGRQIAEERFDELRVFEIVKAEYARLLSEKGLPIPEPRRRERIPQTRGMRTYV
jgi:glycosyltransferase involved in cell wall biosynthesis